MKLSSCQNMSVLGFVGPEILIVFCDHQTDIYKRTIVSIHFGTPSQNVLKLILKSHRYVPFGANLSQFVTNTYIPGMELADIKDG